MCDDYGRRGGSVFGAFLLGGVVGAVLGLLFSPRSGKENRELIAQRAQEYWDQGREMYDTGRERVTEIYDTGRERVTDMYETGRETAASRTEEFRTKIDAARDRLKEQVSGASESAKRFGKGGEKAEEPEAGQEKLDISQEAAEEGGATT